MRYLGLSEEGNRAIENITRLVAGGEGKAGDRGSKAAHSFTRALESPSIKTRAAAIEVLADQVHKGPSSLLPFDEAFAAFSRCARTEATHTIREGAWLGLSGLGQVSKASFASHRFSVLKQVPVARARRWRQ